MHKNPAKRLPRPQLHIALQSRTSCCPRRAGDLGPAHKSQPYCRQTVTNCPAPRHRNALKKAAEPNLNLVKTA